MLFLMKLKGHEKNPRLVKLLDAESLGDISDFSTKYNLHEATDFVGTIELSDDTHAFFVGQHGELLNRRDHVVCKHWRRQSDIACSPQTHGYVYLLFWENDDYKVLLNTKEFDPKPSQEIVNHSPDGFSWGYTGSGCAQLALAVLLNETGDVDLAVEHYQLFKEVLIANIPKEVTPFTFYSGEVYTFLDIVDTYRGEAGAKSLKLMLDEWRHEIFEYNQRRGGK